MAGCTQPCGKFPDYPGLSPTTNKCVGDGISADRVHFLYVYAEGTPNKLADGTWTKNDFRKEIGYADTFLDTSGGSAYEQHIRALCWSDLQVRIDEVMCPKVVGPPEAILEAVKTCLAGPPYGYDYDQDNNGIADYSEGKGRLFIAFLSGLPSDDPNAAGIAEVAGGSERLAAGRSPAYSVLWDFSATTLLHELMHTLGAVQNDAPHTSGAGHCFDRSDVMCYNDGGPYYLGPDGVKGTADDGRIKNFCTDDNYLNQYDARVDCGWQTTNSGQLPTLTGEDYWDPSGGSDYLRTHWNTASSRFLSDIGLRLPE